MPRAVLYEPETQLAPSAAGAQQDHTSCDDETQVEPAPAIEQFGGPILTAEHCSSVVDHDADENTEIDPPCSLPVAAEIYDRRVTDIAAEVYEESGDPSAEPPTATARP